MYFEVVLPKEESFAKQNTSVFFWFVLLKKHSPDESGFRFLVKDV
jgi:hypothetical protein